MDKIMARQFSLWRAFFTGYRYPGVRHYLVHVALTRRVGERKLVENALANVMGMSNGLCISIRHHIFYKTREFVPVGLLGLWTMYTV